MIDLSRPAELAFVLMPEIVMLTLAMLLLLWAAWRPDSTSHSRNVGVLALLVTVLVLGVVIYLASSNLSVGPGVVAADSFRWASSIIVLLGAIGAIVLSLDYNGREGILSGESYVLILFATSGMLLLAAARDLMIVFLGIELVSIASYVLVGLNRRSAVSAEGSIKYFLLGAFATAFLLYGIALVYGATGSVNFEVMGARIVQGGLPVDPMLAVGVLLLIVGFGFKVAAAPFHMWAPDVYEGAPTPVTAYMAAAVKAAAFVALLRVFREAFLPLSQVWYVPLWILAAATMFVGNVTALRQKNVKRMLAYSSVAHGGYLLVAVAAGSTLGSGALLFYLFAYTLATIGSFAVIVALGTPGEPGLQINDYSGLWKARPAMALAMAVFMFALLGFPVVGGIGFIGKLVLVQSAIQSPIDGAWSLAVILMLTSVISAGYYMYLVRVMFLSEPDETSRVAPSSPIGTKLVIATCVALILGLGLFPGAALRWSASGAIAPKEFMTHSLPALSATDGR